MPTLEELRVQQRLHGVIPGTAVEVVSLLLHGPDAVQLVFRGADGALGERVLHRADEPELR